MSKKSDSKTYTKPELRDRIKEQVLAGDKGGDPGQWSARKAQLVAQEYEREGGGYKQARKPEQKSLERWGEEHWTTADGEKARRPGGTARYLPEKAWEKLTLEEQAKTNEKKRRGSRAGEQFVANTTAAASARKKAALKKEPAKAKASDKKTKASATPRQRSAK